MKEHSINSHIFVGYSFVPFYGKFSLKYRTYRILVDTHAENGEKFAKQRPSKT